MQGLLFHFSDDPDIPLFEPRLVAKKSDRGAAKDWLNHTPLVWAIDDWHAPVYLFPRDMPRVSIWPLPRSKQSDIDRYWQNSDARIISYIESHRMAELSAATLYRYDFATDGFQSIEDHGVHVCHDAVKPLRVTELTDLPGLMKKANVELRLVDSLVPLRDEDRLWEGSLHASGVRMGFAKGWTD